MPGPRSPRPIAARALVAAALLTIGGTGCQADGPLTRFRSWRDAMVTPASTASDSPADAPSSGLMSRWLSSGKTPYSSGALGGSSVMLGEKGWEKVKSTADPASEAEFDVAKKLFDAKDYAKAEPLLAKLAKKELKKGSPVTGMKAQYYLAESQFQLQQYVKANDNFQILFKKYPGVSEDIKDQTIRREFQIAQIWLSAEDPKAKQLPWQARFDGRAPFIDRASYAVKTLEHVRLHDSGPDNANSLADDAALRIADHYHNTGDFDTAAAVYDNLLTEYPKSEYRERAQLSSIDSKMKGYIGPEYDIGGLEAARKSIKMTQAEFPERIANAEGLKHTDDLITDQEAEREYRIGQYYVRAWKPISAEYQFGLVNHRWPRSKWATLARADMAKIAKAPRKASLPSKIMTAPGTPDPGQGMNNGSPGGALGGLGGLGGGGMGGGMGGGAGGGGPSGGAPY